MGDDGGKSKEADARLARLYKAVLPFGKCGVSQSPFRPNTRPQGDIRNNGLRALFIVYKLLQLIN